MVSTGFAWCLVGVAILVWGSFTIPIKCEAVREANLHPLVFQTYMCVAVALSSLVALGMETPSWTWWGFAGAALWTLGNVCAIGAVEVCCQLQMHSLNVWDGSAARNWHRARHLGCLSCGARSMPITDPHDNSCCRGVLGRPLWATGGANCTVEHLPLALAGLGTVCVGIVGVASVSSKYGNQQESNDGAERLVEADDFIDPNPVHEQWGAPSAREGSNGQRSRGGSQGSHRSASLPRSSSASNLSFVGAVEFGALLDDEDHAAPGVHNRIRLVGGMLAVITALMAGSCLVPVKFAPSDIGVGYAVPFGTGTLVVCLVLVAMRSAVSRVVELEPLEWNCSWKVVGPCLVSGLLWNVGNMSSIVVANSSLGLTIGYPLMQAALVVGGIWGILLYGELSGLKPISLFLSSASVICVGAVLLGMNGACQEDK